MRQFTTGALIALGAALLPLTAQAKPATKPTAKVTPAQAEKAATAKIPGKALSTTYEFEDGHWQYAVLIKKGAALYEVEVNAQTGLVTDTEKTSAAEEASEAAADKKAAQQSQMKGHAAPAGKGEAGEKDEGNEKGG